MRSLVRVLVAVAILALGATGCEQGNDAGGPRLEQATAALGVADAKLDVPLTVLLDRGARPDKAHAAMPDKLLKVRAGRFDGKDDLFLDVLIEADPSAIGRLTALGAEVRTVTSDGIMTATVPLSRVRQLAALDEVVRIEASKRVRLYNDLSNGGIDVGGLRVGMNNVRSTSGAGVVVGVIDTGIDWTHADFIKDATENTATPETRVLYYWDQSDLADDQPPAGFAIGHEYTAANLNVALQNHDNSWDPLTNVFGPVSDPTYPIHATARDTDGHGTHVAGTSAGDGSASGMQGVAPEADLVIVKFDFDGDRNTDANIVDGVNYIFQKAAALGKPAVINMSLGSDYGPHDGTTLEERGIDALAGAGKIVVVAAGNPGAANWSPALRWGYALHGSGALGETFTFRFPEYVDTADVDSYVFFDVWYPGGNKCRVKITTPSGVTYPPASATKAWVTGSAYTGYNTTEGGILVQNGNDPFGMVSNGPDVDAYIEISDYWATAPATGTWTIQLVKADSRSTCAGTFHAWYGASDNVVRGFRDEPTRNPTPRFNGRESDNKVTIGNPASANEVIAAAAYMSRDEWAFAYGVQPDGACEAIGPTLQRYDLAPIGYYDPMTLGELATFSARGPRRDGVLKPEIATPGVGIASSFSHFVRQLEWDNRCTNYWAGGPYHYGTNRVMPGNEATVIQGTSMACPNATGAVAALLQQKGDLDDKCLRKVFAATSAHDAVTDTYQNAPYTAQTDTDTAAAPGAPNADWGYGKMDIAAALAYMTSANYTTCAGACTPTSGCAVGYTCRIATDPCACNTCVAAPVCKPAGTSCTANSQCCSNSCSGKAGRKVCK